MIAQSLSTVWDHVWQSTIFAAAAALVAWALRKNRAHIRYCVWLAASLKFLLPFSLLVAIGGQVEWPAAARPALTVAFKEISQPMQAIPIFLPTTHSGAAPTTGVIPIILFVIWFSGFVIVISRWFGHWRHLGNIVRAAKRVPWQTPIPVLSCESLLEPGVFGIVKPALLLPDGITNHLTSAHLEAILAHELCHVRRHDNLAAAVHMSIEAVFWFHPLVWWLGARLLEERERACDEEVLRLGNQPQIYAESILKTCQFYLESPLECVSGVTGSDLKKRIEQIMSAKAMSGLNIFQKVFLAAGCVAAVMAPLTVGLAQIPQAFFEVASIKSTSPGATNVGFRLNPGGQFTATNVTLKMLVEEAYGVKDSQLSGVPPWFDSDTFDIDAKPEDSAGAAMDKLPQNLRKDQMMRMIQGLLEQRFKLAMDHEARDLPIYALTVVNGAKLHASAFSPPDKLPELPAPPKDGGLPPGGIWSQGPGRLTSTGIELSVFADVLSRFGETGRIVVDETGLTGRYDFSLRWTPEQPSAGGSLFTAVREQLGLRLEAQTARMPFLVIKHVEKPSAI